MPSVKRIFVYPIKSCAGIEVRSAQLTVRGLEFDRRYMLVDASGRFLTQRQHPKMALICPRFAAGGFEVSAPGQSPLHLPTGLAERGHQTCTVRVWRDQVEATLADSDTNVWFSEYMGFACGLVYLADYQHRLVTNEAAAFDDEVGFADGAPLLLISDASLAELNRRLEQPVGIERFRPNLLVTADRAHAEDGWRSVTIDQARLDVAWPCSRCGLITVDPAAGQRDSGGEPLKTLTAYRQRDRAVYFGQNLIPRALGTIDVGAECRIDEIMTP